MTESDKYVLKTAHDAFARACVMDYTPSVYDLYQALRVLTEKALADAEADNTKKE